MKRNLIYICLVFLSIMSCERDDICLEDVTPNIIIRFYDFENQTEFKKIMMDSIKIEGFEAIDNYSGTLIDSIAIPLDVSNDLTKFLFIQNSATETITFNYNRFDEFISRSCGYRTIFNNLTVSENTNHWIQQIEIVNSTINNEEKAHVHIYH